jgi:hypothetical protein
MKQGLVLDKVVLLGRTLDEYRRFFALDLAALRGRKILDVASGVSSFGAEARRSGLAVTAFDAIYELPAEAIEPRCAVDLDHVTDAIRDLKTYRWDFYESPEKLRTFRERAYRDFLADYRAGDKANYVPGRLPVLPFRDGEFDLTLVSYLLFVYEEQLDYEFHQQSLREIMRVTCGEARVYPIVTFEAKRSSYLERLRADPEMAQFDFDVVQTDFEFLLNSNFYLRVRRR